MKTLKYLIFGLFLLVFTMCKNDADPFDEFLKDGYERTESGLFYKFYGKSDREKTWVGDELHGQFWLYWCDELIYSSDTFDMIGRITHSRFAGDIHEGFLMMRVGDSASFILNADSVVKYWHASKDPNLHLCDYLKMTVKLRAIVPIDSVEVLRNDSIHRALVLAKTQDEQKRLQKFLRKEKITVKPNSEGVYVVVKKKGDGAEIVDGKTVVFDYTGRYLDGTAWDSSDEDISYDEGLTLPWRVYKPEQVKIGKRQMFAGLDGALLGQTAGSKLRIILPSEVGLGRPKEDDKDYQPLVLDVDVHEVK